MPEFPKLKTAAMAQDPLRDRVETGTKVLRFVDGAEQRFATRGGKRKSWTVRLELLDEGELAAIEQFFRRVQGGVQTFEFTDPRTGVKYSGCRFREQDLTAQQDGRLDGRTEITIVEEWN